MKVIDSDNYVASGIETFFFPGGEPHVRLPKDFGDALLFLKARTWNDVGIAVCVMETIQRQNYQLRLFAPYFPGARQDRSDGQTPFTAKIMLAALGGSDKIYTFDVHSNYVGDLIDKNFMPSDLFDGFDPIFAAHTQIICPDAGAIDRAKNFDKIFHGGPEIIYCEKHRDFATGKFTDFKMPPLPGVGNYLIVDDICDGGGTFNLLAEEFIKDKYGRQDNCKLELWVSHGIFSKGVCALHPKISKIYTTDSFSHIPANPYHDPRLKVISLQPIIDKILKL